MVEHLFQPSITLFLLGVVLRMSLRLLYGARGPATDDAVYRFMRVISWALLIIPSMVFLVATTHWVSLLLFVIVFEAVVELVVARRQAHRESAWRLLLLAIGSGQPLAESLRYHQSRFRGLVGRWYRRLIADLEHGAPLVEAVWANRSALPREAPVYVNIIESSSTPSRDALRFSDLEDVAVIELRQHIYQRFAYLATVGAMTVVILTFVMIKIAPSYQEIFEDFDLQLPPVTSSFIQISQSVGVLVGVPIFLGFVALTLGAGFIGVLYLCDIPVLRPALDYIGFSQHRAHVLRLLAASISHGLPLDKSLARLEDDRFGYPSSLVRRHLGYARHRVHAGHEWTEALRRSSLITETDAATLRAAEQVGNIPWAMRMLADRTLRLMAFRWGAIESIVFTLFILAIGLVVFWYAVAMFVPLTQMIWNLTG